MNSRRCMTAPRLRRRHPRGSKEGLIGLVLQTQTIRNGRAKQCEHRYGVARMHGFASVLQDELPVKQSSPEGAALAGKIDIGDLKVNRLGFGAMRLCGD